MTDGKATPIRTLPGGARFFNTLGDGKSGQLAWAHTQTGKQPTEYVVYFNTLLAGEGGRLAPPVSLATAQIAMHPCRIRLRPSFRVGWALAT